MIKRNVLNFARFEYSRMQIYIPKVVGANRAIFVRFCDIGRTNVWERIFEVPFKGEYSICYVCKIITKDSSNMCL